MITDSDGLLVQGCYSWLALFPKSMTHAASLSSSARTM
jgi:hypothetical protein